MKTEDKSTNEKGLHTCGLKAFVDNAKKKKAALIREKTVIKK
ncbi:MAG: hypothetical protein V4547_18870 [Bacteroidota bacterium]